MSKLKTFNVYNGEYPFDTLLGSVVAETPEDAVVAAKDKFWQAGHAHPVVSEVADTQKVDHGHSTH